MTGRRLTQRQREHIQRLQERRRERAAQAMPALDDAGLGAESTGLVIAHHGPALIVEDETTTMVTHGFTARIDALGSIVMTRT